RVARRRPRISAFCTQLTTLTKEQVDRGVPFAAACSILRKEYQTRDRVWASFGDYDRSQFERQCRAFAVSYPFGPRHINVKTLFALTRKLPQEIGMAEAVALLGFPLRGTHPPGNHHASYIASTLAEILKAGRKE